MSSPVEVRSKNEVLEEFIALDGSRVVDVGSGAGESVRWMRRKGADAIGIECGPAMQKLALEADPNNPDAYLDGVGQNIPVETGTADAVIFNYSLHHVPEDEMVNALKEAHRILRSGGQLLVMEPIPRGPGFEVFKLVDDETYVRSKAQEALQKADSIGFEQNAHMNFTSDYAFKDADAAAENAVGIDPTRATKMEQHRTEFFERFHHFGREESHGWVFTQENDVKVYTKR